MDTVKTWYRREIILKVQFKSGKIGFIDLASFNAYWNEEPKGLIVSKSEDAELDGVFTRLATWEGFRDGVW